MPSFTYRGRDKSGNLRSGDRVATTADVLNEELSKEGIFATEIREQVSSESAFDRLKAYLHNRSKLLDELAMFARQMSLLIKSGVPIIPAIRQLATFTRSLTLANALNGISDNLEKGKSLSASMELYPNVFSPLIYNLIKIGENTGHLTEAFGHLHRYLEFESRNRKMIKATFRYPIFVIVSIVIAILVLNIFVIPTFAKLYSGLGTTLPWETRALITSSNIVTHYGIFILIGIAFCIYLFNRYVNTPSGRLKFSKFKLRMPIYGNVYRRLLLIRLTQTLAIILNSGIPISQGLTLVKQAMGNQVIEDQMKEAQEQIERGTSFSQAMMKISLFSPLENQIIAVGEKEGELGPSMDYIASFHGSEIEYDLKRLSDSIGPILIGFISVLVLIIALGIYLPIWNMVDLVH